MREKAFKNTNLVASRHIKRENTSFPVDARRLKTSVASAPKYGGVTSCEKVLYGANLNDISLEELLQIVTYFLRFYKKKFECFYYFFSLSTIRIERVQSVTLSLKVPPSLA